MITGDQLVLAFFRNDWESIKKAEAKKTEDRRRRKARKRIAELYDTPCDMICDSDLRRLDEVIQARIKRIRDKWTPEREAEAKGLSLKRKGNYCEYDGRFHAAFTIDCAPTRYEVDEETDFMKELLW